MPAPLPPCSGGTGVPGGSSRLCSLAPAPSPGSCPGAGRGGCAAPRGFGCRVPRSGSSGQPGASCGRTGRSTENQSASPPAPWGWGLCAPSCPSSGRRARWGGRGVRGARLRAAPGQRWRWERVRVPGDPPGPHITRSTRVDPSCSDSDGAVLPGAAPRPPQRVPPGAASRTEPPGAAQRRWEEEPEAAPILRPRNRESNDFTSGMEMGMTDVAVNHRGHHLFIGDYIKEILI